MRGSIGGGYLYQRIDRLWLFYLICRNFDFNSLRKSIVNNLFVSSMHTAALLRFTSNSFEAFQAVMEVRFRHVPGLKKVQNIEYAIHESTSKRKIDLTAPWESVFLPGRKVNMSVVFHRPQTSMSSCPACLTENEIDDSSKGSEIQWWVIIFIISECSTMIAAQQLNV